MSVVRVPSVSLAEKDTERKSALLRGRTQQPILVQCTSKDLVSDTLS